MCSAALVTVLAVACALQANVFVIQITLVTHALTADAHRTAQVMVTASMGNASAQATLVAKVVCCK
jgi:hypothetical protein